MSCEKHVKLYNHLHNHDMEYCHLPKKILFLPISSEFSSLIPWPLETTNLLSTTIVLLFLKCYISGVIEHIFKHNTFEIHSCFLQVSVVHSLLLISISLVCLSSSSLPKSRLISEDLIVGIVA